MSASRRSDSPYHLEATASRGTYTRGTAAWLAITLRMGEENQVEVDVMGNRMDQVDEGQGRWEGVSQG